MDTSAINYLPLYNTPCLPEAEQARIEAEEAQKSDTKDVVAKRMAQEKAKKAAKEAKAAEKAVREAAEKEAKDKEAFMQAKAAERGSAEE